MAAGMHDGLLYAVEVGHAVRAGVGEGSGFFDGEGVDVCTEEEGFARAVFEYGGGAMACGGVRRGL
jgi:hypothetical protein